MQSQDSYRIGPGLRVKLRQMVDAFDGEPSGDGDSETPTRLQDPLRIGVEFHMASFSGSWLKGSSRTVTLAINTSRTCLVTNVFADLSVDCGARKCAIARDGTAWYLIQAEC